MILLPYEKYSIEHQVERIAKIYKVYIEKNELKNDGLIEWISLFRQWISCRPISGFRLLVLAVRMWIS